MDGRTYVRIRTRCARPPRRHSLCYVLAPCQKGKGTGLVAAVRPRGELNIRCPLSRGAQGRGTRDVSEVTRRDSRATDATSTNGEVYDAT